MLAQHNMIQRFFIEQFERFFSIFLERFANKIIFWCSYDMENDNENDSLDNDVKDCRKHDVMPFQPNLFHIHHISMRVLTTTEDIHQFGWKAEHLNFKMGAKPPKSLFDQKVAGLVFN